MVLSKSIKVCDTCNIAEGDYQTMALLKCREYSWRIHPQVLVDFLETCGIQLDVGFHQLELDCPWKPQYEGNGQLNEIETIRYIIQVVYGVCNTVHSDFIWNMHSSHSAAVNLALLKLDQCFGSAKLICRQFSYDVLQQIDHKNLKQEEEEKKEEHVVEVLYGALTRIDKILNICTELYNLGKEKEKESDYAQMKINRLSKLLQVKLGENQKLQAQLGTRPRRPVKPVKRRPAKRTPRKKKFVRPPFRV